MNIKISFPCISGNFFNVHKDSFLDSLSVQHKKVIVVASIAFAFLAFCYGMTYAILKGRMNNEEADIEEEFFKEDRHSPKMEIARGEPEKRKSEQIDLKNQEKEILGGERLGKGTSDVVIVDGEGKRTLPDGTIEEGTFKEGNLNGKGKRILPDLVVEKGNFKEGKLDQQGTRILADLTTEQGTFENGLLNGFGKMSFSDGRIWKGEFKAGKLHGKGIILQTDGTILRGTFKEGELAELEKGLDFDLPKEPPIDEPLPLDEHHPTKPISSSLECVVKEGVHWEGTLLDGMKVIVQNDMSVLIGTMKDDQLNGPGKFFTSKGAIWEGTFKDNKLSGPGKFKNKIGDLLQGVFEDDQLHGKGEIIRVNGDTCEGMFQKGKLHGKGKYIQKSGAVYEGIFEEGQIREGKHTFDKNTYEGTFRNWLLDGKGKKILKDRIEEGTFYDGKLHGEGKIVVDGEPKWEGTFTQGWLTQGTVHLPDGVVVEGDFKYFHRARHPFSDYEIEDSDDEDDDFVRRPKGRGDRPDFHVKGQVTETDGIRWEGEFDCWSGKDGDFTYQFCGKGKKILPNGSEEGGTFKDGKLNGEGWVSFSGKVVIEGMFVDDKLNGKGKKVATDGTIEEGIFEDDILHGMGTRTYPDGKEEKGKYKKGILQKGLFG